jgi:hypothetical protein
MEFEVGIVLDTILDSSNGYFNRAGEWDSLNAVYFEKVRGGNYLSKGFAKPLFSNITHVPVKGELVILLKLPSQEIEIDNIQDVYYYLPPINIWNSIHHNSAPTATPGNNLIPVTANSYQEVERGLENITGNQQPAITLGDSFIEKTNIKPLTRFEGDILMEGRGGNSIRLGSTNRKNNQTLNPWSEKGVSGDPILILRNGQKPSGEAGFVPTTEDINLDKSSIYLTAGQKIPLTLAGFNNFISYKKKPIPVINYSGNQILLNSDRIVVNAKKDHIILGSDTSINLTAGATVNLEATSEIILQTEKVLLASSKATEPVLLGETLVEDIKQVVAILKELLVEGSRAANTGGTLGTFNTKCIELSQRISQIDFETSKSKYVFTV